MTSMAFGPTEPMTTRSGFMKSSMAAPSFRNSGLETMSKSCVVSGAMTAWSWAQVPTGTVLLVTTTR
jgi:hypothetical protein